MPSGVHIPSGKQHIGDEHQGKIISEVFVL